MRNRINFFFFFNFSDYNFVSVYSDDLHFYTENLENIIITNELLLQVLHTNRAIIGII